MTIATQQDVIDHLGINGAAILTQLSDPNNAFIDTVLVSKMLKKADDEIYARLSGVTLPLSSPYPALLVTIACVITVFWLWSNGRPENVKQDYDRSIKLLSDIREGKASLGLSGDGTGPVEMIDTGPAYSAADRLYTYDTLVDF